MKKLSALLLALLMVMTCFTGCFGKNNDAQTSDESQSVSDSVDTSDEVTENNTDSVNDDFADDYSPEYTVDIELSESNPDAETNDVPTGDIADAVKELLGEGYLPSMALDGHADDVEKALNDYQEYTLENSLQYPANVAKLNAARVYRLGDYVFYILLAAVPDEYMDDEEGRFDFCVANNQMVVDKINELLLK